MATRHAVSLSGDRLEFDAPSEAVVNSYHEWAVPKSELASQLEILAVSEDGWVEALRHREAPITAVQWHPERDNPVTELDRFLTLNTLEEAK